jgi:uncharacterized membrane protein YebE (DUF533 family)
MINVNKMLASLSRSGMMKGSGSSLFGGGALSGGALLGGGIAGGIAGSLLTSKSGRKTGAKALKIGTLAAVGGIAWKAYKSYSDQQAQDRAFNQGKYEDYSGSQQSQQPRQASQFAYDPQSLNESQFNAVVDEKNTEGQLLLLRAMVAAANADGHIDQTERMKIFDQVDGMDLGTEDKSSLFDEMRNPLSIEQLVAKVPCSEAAAEVYAISAIALDLSHGDSRIYLDKLARQLCIPSQLQHSLEDTGHDARLSVHA